MLSGRFLKSIAALAIVALPACSAGTSALTAPSPNTVSSGTQRSPEVMRAFAANTPATAASCSGSAGVTNVGTCSNIQLGGVAYGPNTPGQLLPGLHPADLQAAYHLPSATAGSGQTIGIVIVNDDPNAEADLAVYRLAFGLPPCTSLSGCLRIVAAKGKLKADPDWSRELSIDVDMASAVCPKCKLLVAEAASTKDKDLADAVSLAVADGANVVSNSYAIAESGKEKEPIEMWSHPGIPIVAAAGDQGYTAANWPAASPGAIAVGATTLTLNGSTARGWTETAWSGSGSGCSSIAPKPVWQTDTGCAMRTVADVVAVGDPATPVAVFDTYQDVGWVQMGGTSVSTPIVAGVYALAANGAQLNAAASLYADRSALFAVSSGSNGTCSPSYLCSAGAGYSGLGGLGSPNGIAAF